MVESVSPSVLQVSIYDSGNEKAIWKGNLTVPIKVETIMVSVEELFSLKSSQASAATVVKASSKGDGKKVSLIIYTTLTETKFYNSECLFSRYLMYRLTFPTNRRP